MLPSDGERSDCELFVVEYHIFNADEVLSDCGGNSVGSHVVNGAGMSESGAYVVGFQLLGSREMSSNCETNCRYSAVVPVDNMLADTSEASYDEIPGAEL
jgi:hypothetical protein